MLAKIRLSPRKHARRHGPSAGSILPDPDDPVTNPVPLVSPGRRIACRVSVPPEYAGKARYALEALLVPLGLEPVFDAEMRVGYGGAGPSDAEPRVVHGEAEPTGGEPRVDFGEAESTGREPQIVYGQAESTGAEPQIVYAETDPSNGGPQFPGGDAGPADVAGRRVIRLAFAPRAAEYFRARRPFDPGEAVRVDVGGVSLPVPFTDSYGRPDWVASAFLYLSGWHEAHAAARDTHGRVPFEATLPGILGAADLPVVDAYRSALATQLERAGVDVRPRQWEGRAWALCPTHDVDYIRKWRPGIIYREAVEHLLLNRRRESLGARTQRVGRVLAQMAAGDPYRKAVPRMIEEVAERGGTATYFVKGGAGDPHDVPYAVDGGFMQRQLRELKRRAFEVGLHPSYRTVDEPDRLEAERDAMAAVAGPVRSVRQHYLRFDPARTPALHARLGFQIDSTIGFADRPGFRRGTCVPFRLYDLAADEQLDAWEMPLIIMESALFNRQNLTAAEARAATETCMEACRRYGGACVALWHNTLWDEIDCPGWANHFIQTLDAAAHEGARLASLETALKGWR